MYSSSELLHFPNLKNVEKSKFPVHFRATVMILRYDIYKTIREFDNNPGLGSVILTSCIVAYLYLFFRNDAFILLLSFLILGMRDLLPTPPQPHHCTQEEYIHPITQ